MSASFSPSAVEIRSADVWTLNGDDGVYRPKRVGTRFTQEVARSCTLISPCG
jgi:hypothetical protein